MYVSLNVSVITVGNKAGNFVNVRLYTGCPGGNVPDFWRLFLKLKYTDITQNTYVQI